MGSEVSSLSISVRSTKGIVFVALMGALGNILSGLSIMVSPIVPSIPLGPINVSLALDLSHVTTFIVALFGGPIFGGATGMIGGIVSAYQFGFSQGNIITGFAIPVGKALTGVAAGLIMRTVGSFRRRLMMVPMTVASYVPEALFTVFIFIIVFPAVFGPAIAGLVTIITAQIIAKAFVEMVIMGLILATLLGNRGFTEYLNEFFGHQARSK